MDSAYLESLFSVKDKVVALTGGGGILCGAMARALGRLGAKVVVLDLLADAAQRVADDVTAQGGEALALRADVLDQASIEASLQKALERFGRVDALINGAGGNKKEATTSPDLSFFDLPPDAFQWVFNLNFMGTLLPTQIYGNAMADQGEGVILNIASVNVFRPLTKIPAYSTAKAAVKNLTEWLAVHLAQNYSPKIRVNALAPGFFITNQSRFLLWDAATNQPTPRGQSVLTHTPMARFGEPDELIAAVVWLLSPGASFVNGATITIDGGLCAYSGI